VPKFAAISQKSVSLTMATNNSSHSAGFESIFDPYCGIKFLLLSQRSHNEHLAWLLHLWRF